MSTKGPRSEKDQKEKASKEPGYVHLYSYTQTLGDLAKPANLLKLRDAIDGGKSEIDKKEHADIVALSRDAVKQFNFHFFSTPGSADKVSDARFLFADAESLNADIRVGETIAEFYANYSEQFSLKPPSRGRSKSMPTDEDSTEKSADYLLFLFEKSCFESVKNTYDSVMLRNYLSAFDEASMKEAHPFIFDTIKKQNNGKFVQLTPVTEIQFTAEYAFEDGISFIRTKDNGLGMDLLDAFKAKHSQSFRDNQLNLSEGQSLETYRTELDDNYGPEGVFAKIGLRTGGAGAGQKLAETQLVRFARIQNSEFNTKRTSGIGYSEELSGKSRFTKSLVELFKFNRHEVQPTDFRGINRGDRTEISFINSDSTDLDDLTDSDKGFESGISSPEVSSPESDVPQKVGKFGLTLSIKKDTPAKGQEEATPKISKRIKFGLEKLSLGDSDKEKEPRPVARRKNPGLRVDVSGSDKMPISSARNLDKERTKTEKSVDSEPAKDSSIKNTSKKK